MLNHNKRKWVVSASKHGKRVYLQQNLNWDETPHHFSTYEAADSAWRLVPQGSLKDLSGFLISQV